MREYEALQEAMGRLSSYAQLLFAADSSNPANGRFYQTITERVTVDQHAHAVLHAGAEPAGGSGAGATSCATRRWRAMPPWLRDLRVFRPHQLSDELEKLLHEKEVTGHAAWSRLFDETIAAMRVNVNGEELTLTAALNKLSDADRAVREAAGQAIGEGMARQEKLFSLITNTLAKDKEIIDQWRHYPRRPPSATAPTWWRTRWWTRWSRR